MTDQCTTQHGVFRCERPHGHDGPCEAQAPPYDYDAQRELAKAARRIVELEGLLRAFLTAPCARASYLGDTCVCCTHVRAAARRAVER